jgi:hypothetical protein
MHTESVPEALPMGPAKFSPGKPVALFTSEGAEILARPFFYTDQMGNGLRVELYTDDGGIVHCIDESKGIYSLAGFGTPLFLSRNHSN